MHRSLKLVGYAVVALMGVAVAYALYTSVAYWSGIGV